MSINGMILAALHVFIGDLNGLDVTAESFDQINDIVPFDEAFDINAQDFCLLHVHLQPNVINCFDIFLVDIKILRILPLCPTMRINFTESLVMRINAVLINLHSFNSNIVICLIC